MNNIFDTLFDLFLVATACICIAWLSTMEKTIKTLEADLQEQHLEHLKLKQQKRITDSLFYNEISTNRDLLIQLHAEVQRFKI